MFDIDSQLLVLSRSKHVEKQSNESYKSMNEINVQNLAALLPESHDVSVLPFERVNLKSTLNLYMN